jgi:type VI protein secretion system component VasF
MPDKIKYAASAVVVLAVFIGYNMFLINRDQQLFKAYDACSRNHPSCVYYK